MSYRLALITRTLLLVGSLCLVGAEAQAQACPQTSIEDGERVIRRFLASPAYEHERTEYYIWSTENSPIEVVKDSDPDAWICAQLGNLQPVTELRAPEWYYTIFRVGPKYYKVWQRTDGARVVGDRVIGRLYWKVLQGFDNTGAYLFDVQI